MQILAFLLRWISEQLKESLRGELQLQNGHAGADGVHSAI